MARLERQPELSARATPAARRFDDGRCTIWHSIGTSFSGRGLDLMGTVEEVGGLGDLFRSEILIRSGVRYHLTVRGRTALGLTDVEPWIDLTDAESHTYLGETLSLHLQDGRWFNFIVLSTSGTVAAAGGGIRDPR